VEAAPTRQDGLIVNGHMPPTVFPLDNTVQNYAWGSTTAIADFLERPSPGGLPEAELWIGAHPKAPSRVRDEPAGPGLDALIRRDPVAMLGEAVVARYGELPFLLKVLAAQEPLSIQCHPNSEQARAGFARENEAGIPLGDPRRNYRDPNHKPELLVALTRTLALKGFRPVEEIRAHFEAISFAGLREPIEALGHPRDAAALRRLFAAMLSLDPGARSHLLGQALAEAGGRRDPAWRWVARLHQKYPGDVGVLAPLLLNLMELQPEEAVFLGAGELHAYLEGTGLEIMANSDNVLRGGLTSKHMDVAELLATATFEPSPARSLRPEPSAGGERVYRTPAPEFELGLIDVSPEAPFVPPDGRGVELLLGVLGKATVVSDGRTLSLSRGRSVFVPAAVPAYRLEGEGQVCRARVPNEAGAASPR
jgi:mannose-6-phosphate isomerase